MATRKATLSIRKVQERVPAAPPLEKFTIDEAFFPHITLDPIPGETSGAKELREQHFDLERGVRAVALLLSQASNVGNDSVEGMEAQGLSFILMRYADGVANLVLEHQRQTAFAVEVAEENARRSARA